MTLFTQLGLTAPILRALADKQYTQPTPVQSEAIPILLAGKDVLGSAQTGTGKTAAFAIPVLQRLAEKTERSQLPQVLVLTPTRELAEQVGNSFRDYGKYLPVRYTVIYGGVSQRPQTDALRRGVDIIVATPGRLMDLMQQGFVKLQQINTLILDEADQMMDMGFIDAIRRIIRALPDQRQNIMFSATISPEIQKLASSVLVQPVKVNVQPTISSAESISQLLYFVEKNNKNGLLEHVLQQETGQALVFTKTKRGADKVSQDLNRKGIKADAIHGNKTQSARQRALNNFKRQSIQVLVATDVAARGLDITGLAQVINFDLPNTPETYVHRIGRTGRAGAQGIARSFCDSEEKGMLRDINRFVPKPIPVAENHPFQTAGSLAIQANPGRSNGPAPRGYRGRTTTAPKKNWGSYSNKATKNY